MASEHICHIYPDGVNMCGAPATKSVKLTSQDKNGHPQGQTTGVLWLCDDCYANPYTESFWASAYVRYEY